MLAGVKRSHREISEHSVCYERGVADKRRAAESHHWHYRGEWDRRKQYAERQFKVVLRLCNDLTRFAASVAPHQFRCCAKA